MHCKLTTTAFALCISSVLINFAATQKGPPRWSIDAPNNGRKAPGARLIRTYEMSDQVKQAIVEAHNEGRSNVVPPPTNMRKISWDNQLADEAAKFARRCIFSMNIPNNLKRFRRVEENVYITDNVKFGSGTEYVRTAAEKWLAEKAYYNFDTKTCRAGKNCDRYRQMVWADTFLVGCAVTKCSAALVNGALWNGINLMVCSYAPGGNWISSTPYKTGPVCSECHPTDTCVNKLCTNPARDVNRPAPVWTEWSPWTPCSKTCGLGGSRSRTRFCSTFVNTDCGGVSRQSQFLCARGPCDSTTPTAPTPGPRWNRWGNWGECSKTCGGGERSRTRTCSTGKTTDCAGSSTTSIPCNARPCPAWGAWRSWESCSKTCGGGVRTRSRACNTGTNSDCDGEAAVNQDCNTQQCAAGGRDYSQWVQWSRCSKSCGNGVKTRTRRCLKSSCPDKLRDTKRCFLKSCPAQRREWSPWGTWTECTKSCGIGIRSRSRKCQGSTGPSCSGSSSNRVACNTQKCPATEPEPAEAEPAAQWKSWGKWSECTRSCGGGIRFRIRECSDDDDSRCCGLSHATSSCNEQACPTAVWSSWGRWESVGDSCLADTQVRRRTCSSGNPQECCRKN